MNVTCNKCGWVHFQVSRAHAVAEVERFNAFFDTLAPQEQQDYYGGRGASIRLYEHCHFCDGPHTNFRDTIPGDVPDGCTIGPMIDRNE